MVKSGWYQESHRHSLASKCIKTGRKTDSPLPMPTPSKAGLPGQAEFWPSLWIRNKGYFYRGTADNGKGQSIGLMGDGLYITWDHNMATAFGMMSDRGKGYMIKRYKVAKDVKLMDWESKEMWQIRKGLGVESLLDKIADPVFAKILTFEVKKRGFDGIISDDVANGIVIFDQSKIKEAGGMI